MELFFAFISGPDLGGDLAFEVKGETFVEFFEADPGSVDILAGDADLLEGPREAFSAALMDGIQF